MSDLLTTHSPTELATVVEQPQALMRHDPMTISQLIVHAIDRGVDADSLEKLVALQEREVARHAKAAFHAARRDFKARCPKIGHTKAVNEGALKYSYTELPALLDAIDPTLAECGLSYSFDAALEAESMTTICTISHVDGHSEQSRFTCKVNGTRAMSSAQMSGSAITFGRRYSLQMALGFCTDRDDDGRAVTSPPENPEADPNAKRAQPRGSRVDARELLPLFDAFKKYSAKCSGNGTKEELLSWAIAACGLPGDTTVDAVLKPLTWSRAALESGLADLKGYLQ